jgi:hypothetical protein
MSSSNTTRRGRAISVRSSDKSSAAMSVYDGRCCIGFIITHGRTGYESFDVDQHSVGLFSNERDAATALWRIARGQLLTNQEKNP